MFNSSSTSEQETISPDNSITASDQALVVANRRSGNKSGNTLYKLGKNAQVIFNTIVEAATGGTTAPAQGGYGGSTTTLDGGMDLDGRETLSNGLATDTANTGKPSDVQKWILWGAVALLGFVVVSWFLRKGRSA
jgi:hypothetical protein